MKVLRMRSKLFHVARKSKMLIMFYAVRYLSSWLKAQGYDNSLKTLRAVDADNKAIPWYTYPLIEYLRQFDFKGCRVFEFGCGHSTLFWASRCAEVIAVEHNPEWYEHMRARLPGNVTLLLRQNAEEYAAAIKEMGGEFDIVVIDGEWRLMCAKESFDLLSSSGLMLVDNSDWFVDTSQYLRTHGLFQIDFNGPGPINQYAWTSSLFMHAPTRIQQAFSDPLPLTGIVQKVNENG
ncbi:MAG: hypothetical protein PHH47_04905 [Gallionella sp.]|nr:hypothetical protein [Gallionella sp.]MDD4947124.1 hypothetical protein [Gallionella sp.]MDD5611466.1 hypothetical protein [Gallionella sp.]